MNKRCYGDIPYQVALVHGGPGAPGDLAPVAGGLRCDFSVLELLQSKGSIDELVEEMREELVQYEPMVIMGHSWGAWLTLIFASLYPKLTKHIILVACPPLESKYAEGIMDTRLSRLNLEDKKTIDEIFERDEAQTLTQEDYETFGKLMENVDAYSKVACKYPENPLPVQKDNSKKIWKEGEQYRKSGKILEIVSQIKCPMTFIHGAFDPHPYQGVQDVLNEKGVDFEFLLMQKCGHTPWIEEHVADNFFKMLKVYIKEFV